jgi:hypothetical protein
MEEHKFTIDINGYKIWALAYIQEETGEPLVELEWHPPKCSLALVMDKDDVESLLVMLQKVKDVM